MLTILPALLMFVSCDVEPRVPYTEGTPADREAYLERKKQEARDKYIKRRDTAPRDIKANLNTATKEEFMALVPDLGEKMAHEFEEYRPYKSVSVFRKEMLKYAPPEMVERYLDHAYVPIDINNCDVATIQQIEGITTEAAESLIAGRPYDSVDAFVQQLSRHTDPDIVEYSSPWLVKP